MFMKNLNQEVFGSLAIPVNTQGKTVVKETSIKSKVNLL